MRLRLMISFLCSLIVLAVSIFLLVRFLEKTSVFYPGRTLSVTPAHVGMPFEDLYIQTPDGIKINAWFVRSSDKASTIVFAHGNAGTMSERVIKMKFWHDLGLNVLMFDYRGYGHSEGHPTEKGVYLDAQAAYDYLLTRKDIDTGRIIGYGASLGGVVVTNLAAHRKLSALIVESSITSAKDMAHRLYPMIPSFFMSIKFDSLSKVGKITCPKLFLHSQEDRVVPYAMSRKLFDAACEPKGFIEIHGGHNDMGSVTDPCVREELTKFLKRYSLL